VAQFFIRKNMGTFKIKKILIPLDFSKTSLKALDYAVAISQKCKAAIILLHVSEWLYQNVEPGYFVSPEVPMDYQQEFIDQSNVHLNKLAENLKEKGVTKITMLTEVGNVHKEIIAAAKKNKVDLIVMGTHGVSGAKEFFTGSNTFRVIRDAKCPVLSVQHKNKIPGFKNILVPFSDRPHSREKVNYAIDLALMFSAEINILGVDDDVTKSHKKKMEMEAAQIKKIAEEYGVKCKTKIISEKYIGDVVLKYARSINADLIVSSDLDKADITEYFTGAIAQQIVNHSPIPVLSIRPSFNTDTVDLRFY
jgi:nucleotide-binding universal stress UspA family protein